MQPIQLKIEWPLFCYVYFYLKNQRKGAQLRITRPFFLLSPAFFFPSLLLTSLLIKGGKVCKRTKNQDYSN